jgi:hypothetical protein
MTFNIYFNKNDFNPFHILDLTLNLANNTMTFLQFVLDIDSRNWNWSDLSSNPNIFFEDVLRNPEKPWDYIELSRNPNITLDIVDSHPEIYWSYSGLTKNPNITMDIMKRRSDIPWDRHTLSENPSITWECIQSNPYIKWDYSHISQNPNITWSIISSNIHLFDKYNRELSRNPNVSWDIVTTMNKKIDWDYHSLMGNPAITFYDVYENLNHTNNEDIGQCNILNSRVCFRDCWFGLSMNPNVTWEMIQSQDEEFNGVKWSDYFMCINPNINIKIVRENPQLQYYQKMSKNMMDYYPWHFVKSLIPHYILK